MFEVDKPRRFHYEPRLYDPEKEKWEALKKKYAIEQEKQEAKESAHKEGDEDDELEYFERRIRDLDREDRAQASKMTWKDLFRKREMPKFNYQPRFSGNTTAASAPTEEPATDADITEKYRQAKHKIKIKRRYDISDTNYMKPVSGTKIILYCFVVFLLITLIIRF